MKQNYFILQVKADLSKQSNEHEIVDFIVERFKIYTGLGKEGQRHRRVKRKTSDENVYTEGKYSSNMSNCQDVYYQCFIISVMQATFKYQ